MENDTRTYPNWMTGITDIAQTADYNPAYLLPMPKMQCFLWLHLDNRPVKITLEAPEAYTFGPDDPGENRVLRCPPRADNHVEDAYLAAGGWGEDDTVVYYRCGYAPTKWLRIERP